MEAQAAAQQMAAQQAAQAAVLSSCHRSPVKRESNSPVSTLNSSDEPTDLSVSNNRASIDREKDERERERLERERYYSQLMERYNIERSSPARDRSEERETEPKSHFDYRHLIPQVSIKTESCWKTFRVIVMAVEHFIFFIKSLSNAHSFQEEFIYFCVIL